METDLNQMEAKVAQVGPGLRQHCSRRSRDDATPPVHSTCTACRLFSCELIGHHGPFFALAPGPRLQQLSQLGRRHTYNLSTIALFNATARVEHPSGFDRHPLPFHRDLTQPPQSPLSLAQ